MLAIFSWSVVSEIVVDVKGLSLVQSVGGNHGRVGPGVRCRQSSATFCEFHSSKGIIAVVTNESKAIMRKRRIDAMFKTCGVTDILSYHRLYHVYSLIAVFYLQRRL